MPAYHKVEVSLNANAVEVGVPEAQTVNVVLPLVGPAGATGPAGAAGASAWNDITGKPATFPPSAHDHQPDEVYADAAFVSQTGGSGRGGIYLRNGSDNGKPLYESPATGDYIWWDSNIDTWYLTSRTGVNLYYLDENSDQHPWETDALWSPIPSQTGNIEVDQATLADVSDYSSTSVVGLKTPKSGNASSDELVLGSDTRLTNSRTPTAHASTHHTGGSDPLTPANIGAAPAVPLIEVTIEDNFDLTLTTSQVPSVLVFLIDSDVVNPQVNLSLPASLNYEKAGAEVIIRLVREAGTTTGIDLSVSAGTGLFTGIFTESSTLTFRWDGVRWLRDNDTLDSNFRILGSADPTKKLAFEVDGLTTGTTRTLTVPDASGTIARTEDFAAPPAIGNTTPNSGAFTTLSANNGTLNASAPVLDLSQTWNNSGTTFVAFNLNVTETAAGGNSALFRLQRGGTTLFSILRDGTCPHSLTVNSCIVANAYLSDKQLKLNNAGTIDWSSTSNKFGGEDLTLTRDAADTLAQRRGINQPQTFRIYNTFSDANNYERGFMRWSSNVLQIGTEKGGTGSARNLQFQTDGITRVTIQAEGIVTGAALFLSNSTIDGQGDSGASIRLNPFLTGHVIITKGLLRMHGSSASFPALKRSSTTLQVRLADDSAFAPLSCGALTLNGNLDASTRDLVTDTTTGTKIGTATTQKIGFFNATPVVQQAAIADATDAATTQARLNDLLATMRTFGLIAT